MPVMCGTILWGRDLGLSTVETSTTSQHETSFSLFFWAEDTMKPVLPISAAVLPCHDGLEVRARVNPFSHKLFFSVHFITATGKQTGTLTLEL